MRLKMLDKEKIIKVLSIAKNHTDTGLYIPHVGAILEAIKDGIFDIKEEDSDES